MALEDEICQKKFKHEFQKVVVNIKHTTNWINQQNAERLKPFGITPQKFNILSILRGQRPRPVTVNAIKEHMLFKESNVSRLVEKLRKAGLARRTISSQDRRAVDVVISDKGLGLLEKIDTTEPGWVLQLKRLSEQEAQDLNRLLDKLRGPERARRS